MQLAFRQPPGRALVCCCFRSIGSQSHCQQCHLTMIVDELPLQFIAKSRKVTSNDNIVVGMRRKLGGLVVDCSIGLRKGNSEEQQRFRAGTHGGGHQRSPQPRFIPTRVVAPESSARQHTIQYSIVLPDRLPLTFLSSMPPRGPPGGRWQRSLNEDLPNASRGVGNDTGLTIVWAGK